MEILNRFNMQTTIEDYNWIAIMSVIVAVLGGFHACMDQLTVAFWMLFASTLLSITYVLMGEVFIKDLGIELIECCFFSQEDFDQMMEDYVVLDRRGLIYTLIKKEDMGK